MTIRRRELLAGLIGAGLSFLFDTAIAADIPKLKCTRLGQSVIYRNQKFTCIKKGGKLVWDKGQPISVKSPSASPSPSTTPASATSVTPAPTPSATPSPSPTSSKTKALIKIANSSDVPANSVKLIESGATTGLIISILLIRDSDGLRALQAECPHAGYIIKDNGGSELICQKHNSLFSAKNGAVLRGPSAYGLEIYPVSETGGEIFITL